MNINNNDNTYKSEFCAFTTVELLISYGMTGLQAISFKTTASLCLLHLLHFICITS